LAIAKKAKKEFNLDAVIFVPTGTPPHKHPATLADKEARYQMVLKAIKRYPSYHASRTEVDRRGFSYAVDTLNRLKEEFGPNSELYYLMGLDSINEILEWRKPLDLFKYCEFVVATRPGAKIRTMKRLLKFPPLKFFKDKIHLIELREAISASEIRHRIAKGQDAAKLTPKVVLEYIQKKGLYQEKKK
jgi:nicotinate-nucleotide adenylyltransferase